MIQRQILDATEKIIKQIDEIIAYQKETIEMVKNWKPKDWEAKHEEMEENNAVERPEIYN